MSGSLQVLSHAGHSGAGSSLPAVGALLLMALLVLAIAARRGPAA